MDRDRVDRLVEELRGRGVMAHVQRGGVYEFGIRVVLPDGREAVWDADGASGLEATILQDGDLVGYVPVVPGSEDLDDAGVVAVIASADYPPT